MQILNIQKVSIKNLLKMLFKGQLNEMILIVETIKNLPDDLDLKRTDKLLKIIIFAAIFELMFKHNNPLKL